MQVLYSFTTSSPDGTVELEGSSDVSTASIAAAVFMLAEEEGDLARTSEEFSSSGSKAGEFSRTDAGVEVSRAAGEFSRTAEGALEEGDCAITSELTLGYTQIKKHQLERIPQMLMPLQYETMQQLYVQQAKSS